MSKILCEGAFIRWEPRPHTKESYIAAAQEFKEFLSEIMRQPWPPRLKKGSGTFHRGFNPEKAPPPPQSPYRKQDSTNSHQNVFFADFEHTTPSVRKFLVGRRSMNPGQAPPDSGEPEERRRPHGHTISGHDKKPGVSPGLIVLRI